MNIKRFVKAGILLAAWASQVASAADCAPCVYPASEVFGWPSESNQRPALSPVFVETFPKSDAADSARVKLGLQFVEEMKKAFSGQIVDVVDQRNAANTFVASLHVLRASTYQIKKIDGTVDHYFPVSMTLSFTNPLTGEVLTSFSETQYTVISVLAGIAPEDLRQKSVSAFAGRTRSLAESLVNKARKEFKPFRLSAQVRKEWNGYFILDKGQDEGLARGDQLENATGSVMNLVHVGLHYAVGLAELGTIREGDEFGRYSVQSVGDIKKPRAVLLTDKMPTGNDVYVNQMLGDQLLAARAGLSLTPVNDDFTDLINWVHSHTKIERAAVKENRLMPELFVRLKVINPLFFEIPTNIASVSMRQTTSRVTGTLIDATGRVVYGNVGEDSIEEKIAGGQGFNQEDRNQISLKNALLDLAKKFATDVQLKTETYAIDSTEKLSFSDPNGLIPESAEAHVFRDIGKVDGVTETNVLIPISTAQVQRDSSGSRLGGVIPLADRSPTPKAGDKVRFISDGRSFVGLRKYALCKEARPTKGNILYREYPEIAFALAGKHLKPALYVDADEFARQVSGLVENRGFKKDVGAKYVVPDDCLNPAYNFKKVTAECKGGECRHRVDAVTGYAVHIKGSEPKVIAKKNEIDLPLPADVDSEIPVLTELTKKAIHTLPSVLPTIN